MADGGRRRRLKHVFARSGWAICAVLCGLLFVLMYIVDQVDDQELGKLIVGAIVVLFPLGGVIGAGIGWVVQMAARGVLRAAGDWPPPEVAAGRHAQVAGPGAWPVPVPTVSPYDGMDGDFRADYRRCEAAVERFRAIVASAAESPAKDWLRGLAGDLDAELVEAGRLARLGSALARGNQSTAAVPADQLKTAAASFDATAAQAGEIALTLAEGPEFERVRAQLDMLASQAPTLRAAPDS